MKQNGEIISLLEFSSKKSTFTVHKCKLLKIQCANHRDDTFEIDQNIEIVDSFKYLGDEFASRGDYLKLCK